MAQPRVYWTSNAGKSRSGVVLLHFLTRNNVLVRMDSGQRVEVPVAKLIAEPVNRKALKGMQNA